MNITGALSTVDELLWFLIGFYHNNGAISDIRYKLIEHADYEILTKHRKPSQKTFETSVDETQNENK